MSEPNPMLKTIAVKNYLLQCINRAGIEPERLPGEMNLCKKFKVSRITVRRAIKELEKTHYIIRIPEKKGAFTNPEMAQAVSCITGIVCGDGKRNYFAAAYLSILSSLMQEIHEVYSDIEFVILNSSELPDLAEEIKTLSYDALVWFSPPQRYIPMLEALIREGKPILMQNSIFEENKTSTCNSVGYDYCNIGLSRAKAVLACGAKNIVYIGERNTTFESFSQILKRNGIDFSEENLIEKPEDITVKLPALLARKKIDAIISDGGIHRYHTVIQILQNHPEWKMIKLFLTPSHLEEKLQKRYPELQILFCRPKANTIHEKFGRLLGKQIKEILKGKHPLFDNIKLKIQEED